MRPGEWIMGEGGAPASGPTPNLKPRDGQHRGNFKVTTGNSLILQVRKLSPERLKHLPKVTQ